MEVHRGNGAQRVVDINSAGSSYSECLTVYNNMLYFAADGGDGSDYELWMYSEIEGAQRVADIYPGSGSSITLVQQAVVYNNALYFGANGNDGAGIELWKYDLTHGAMRISDLIPGLESSRARPGVVYNGSLYFRADYLVGSNPELWKYDNTATAIFRPTKPYDGWTLESGENTSVGGTINSAATTFNIGDDAQNKQYRAILSFNTSTLPDNAVITSATLKIRKQGGAGTNPFTTHGNIAIDIVKGAFGGNNALQANDFQFAPGKAGAGVFKNLPDVNNWFTSVLAKTAYPFINPTGVTQFRLRFATDDNNDNGADFLRFFSADSANMSDYPILEVKYYLP